VVLKNPENVLSIKAPFWSLSGVFYNRKSLKSRAISPSPRKRGFFIGGCEAAAQVQAVKRAPETGTDIATSRSVGSFIARIGSRGFHRLEPDAWSQAFRQGSTAARR
jgi:hypothetical protein